MVVSIASDHAGYDLRQKVVAHLKEKGFEVLEAAHLFGVGIDDVRVLVQRQLFDQRRLFRRRGFLFLFPFRQLLFQGRQVGPFLPFQLT